MQCAVLSTVSSNGEVIALVLCITLLRHQIPHLTVSRLAVYKTSGLHKQVLLAFRTGKLHQRPNVHETAFHYTLALGEKSVMEGKLR